MRSGGAVGADIHGGFSYHPALSADVTRIRSRYLPEFPDMGMRPMIVLAESAVNRSVLLLPMFPVGTIFMGTGQRCETHRHSGQH